MPGRRKEVIICMGIILIMGIIAAASMGIIASPASAAMAPASIPSWRTEPRGPSKPGREGKRGRGEGIGEERESRKTGRRINNTYTFVLKYT